MPSVQPQASPSGAQPSQSSYGSAPHAPQPYALADSQQAAAPHYGYPPQGPHYAQQQPYGYPPQAGPAVSPGALYPFTPQHDQRSLSLTGQLRLAEVDEVPAQYKLAPDKSWMKYAIGGGVALILAVVVGMIISSASGPELPTVGSVRIESVPIGADIIIDGKRLDEKTPFTLTDLPIGTPHEVRIELPKHKPHVQSITLPPSGAEERVLALLKLQTGTLVVSSTPAGAEVRIDDQIRGRTPTTITELDMASAGRLELRLKDHQPYVVDLKWPDSGELKIDAKLKR